MCLPSFNGGYSNAFGVSLVETSLNAGVVDCENSCVCNRIFDGSCGSGNCKGLAGLVCRDLSSDTLTSGGIGSDAGLGDGDVDEGWEDVGDADVEYFLKSSNLIAGVCLTTMVDEGGCFVVIAGLGSSAAVDIPEEGTVLILGVVRVCIGIVEVVVVVIVGLGAS